MNVNLKSKLKQPQKNISKSKKEVVGLKNNLEIKQKTQKKGVGLFDFINSKLGFKSVKQGEIEIKTDDLKAQKKFEEGLLDIKDLIAPSSLDFKTKNFNLSTGYGKSYFVFDYPGYLDTNWLSPVINYDITMDISMFVYPEDTALMMKFLRNKVTSLRASISINAEKGRIRDPALEQALQDAEELRDQMQRGNEKLFQYGLYFTIYAESVKKLEKISKQIESLLGGKMLLLKPATLQLERCFASCVPFGDDQMQVNRYLNTGPLSTAFPFTSSDLTTNEGILYGINRHNNSLIIFDRFKLENANSVLFAKSGSGKSYAVKLEILRQMMLGTDAIIIDPENEYEGLANVTGGSYLKISLNSDRRINPFDLPEKVDDQTTVADLLRTNIINLEGLLNLMLGGMNETERSIVDKTLLDTYALKGITMDSENLDNVSYPTMTDFYNVLKGMDGTENITIKLEKYITGTYAGVFNKESNVNLNNQLVVFCIRDLEESLRPIAMYIILNHIWNKVRSSLKKRILAIDEAWIMLQNKDSAKFLYGIVKRARKYYLGVTTITQDVEDFLKSHFGKPIITNSSMQILLRQSPAALDILTKVFNLTKEERYLLLNSAVGQGLFFVGSKHVAIEILASYNENRIITTNPEEIINLKKNFGI